MKCFGAIAIVSVLAIVPALAQTPKTKYVVHARSGYYAADPAPSTRLNSGGSER